MTDMNDELLICYSADTYPFSISDDPGLVSVS
jgi:hypothetical protein